MTFKTKSPHAFTLIEVLLVVSIFLVIFGLSVIFAQTSQIRTGLRSRVSVFISHARELRNASAAGKGDGAGYSIRLEEDSYILFAGDTFVEDEPSNTVVLFPTIVRIQNISLNGGGEDIYFRPPFGETDQYGTFQIYSTETGEALTVTIDRLGKVDY